MAKTTILAVLATSFVATGCRPNKGTASPQDYFPLIQVALQGGEVAAMIGRNEAVKAKNFGGCVAADVLSAAFDSAGTALNGKLTGAVVIPGFDIDLSECMALRAAAPGAENASYQTVVVATMVCGSGPAETPSTEAPAEEAPVEEAPAAEPDPEPAVEEADPAAAVKGNEDAAALVEGIAGVAIIAGTHYANKLKATDCKKGTAALAALGYLSGMIKPIADEIANPDGKVSVPAVPVDMSECLEG